MVAARALPQSKLTAVVSLQSYGLSGSKAKLSVRDNGKVLASQDVTLKGDGQIQSETMVFNGGDAGPKSLDIGVEPISGEDNAANNTRVAPGERGEPQAAHPLFRGRAALGVQVHPPRAGRLLRTSSWRRMVRTTQNKLLPPVPAEHGREGTGRGLSRRRPEDLFQFQGLIIGSVEANYFTPAQQQLIHDFVDRRGGGLLFLGGRATLSDGGYPSSPLADLVPTKLPEGKGTFHRDFTGQELTPEGARSIICRLDDDPARNLEKWKKMPQMANYQEVGEEKPGATVLLRSTPAGQALVPAAGDREFRPRPHRAARHRGHLALEDVDRPCRQDARHVLAADLPATW